ncbi:MAG: hypothetical protein OXO48_05405 [Caldilineaceae bacterium]|nr:hypothetical protein [Caldilineaceae bacterium]
MTTANPRALVEDVFARDMTGEIWSATYDKALPITVNDFDLSAVLPAVFYMFRYGQRRGTGKFLEVFGSHTGTSRQRRQSVTVERITERITENSSFAGFDDEVEKAILSDLLLCFCLENARRALGRQAQVQRVAPTHYLASWVDLPHQVGDLRDVPDMIVAMLADQKGEYVQHKCDGDGTLFAVGEGFEDNVLLSAFNQGITRRGELGSRTADQFEEGTPVGLDQLLMIRLAQQLGEAPDKPRGGKRKQKEKISNQQPIAQKAACFFSEDIRRFVHAYAKKIPRHAFVELLESCIALGMTTILTSVIEILLEWEKMGKIRSKNGQEPACLFVDCSNGVDHRLRMLAEQSMDDFMRRVERFPVILMALRLLDYVARRNRKIKGLNIATTPDATAWINLLGDLLYNPCPEAQRILANIDDQSEELAEKLEDEYPEALGILRNVDNQTNPIWRLAEALTSLLGRGTRQRNMMRMIDSTLLIDQPHGLASKRTTTRNSTGTGKRRDTRSFVFTDSVLDYLVHLHVLPSGHKLGTRPLSFKAFMDTLRQRYGLTVDMAPDGMDISNDLLQANRAILERRLRALGLLIGVNDAEAMKRLVPRFQADNGGRM